MKLSNIPAYLRITAAQLSEMAGVSRQVLNDYTRGRRGKASAFVRKICDVAGLHREEVFFPDAFDHPEACNPDHPAYWVSIAIEALNEAKERGLDCDKQAESIHKKAAAMLPED